MFGCKLGRTWSANLTPQQWKPRGARRRSHTQYHLKVVKKHFVRSDRKNGPSGHSDLVLYHVHYASPKGFDTRPPT